MSGVQASVLIVEDSRVFRELLAHDLTREGYRVDAASDGEEALDRLSKHRPDLILLDLVLPGMDGLELCRRLRAKPETRAIPIIMVTSKGEESDVVLGLGLGADDYVRKPFSAKEVVARVRAVLRRGGPGNGEEAPGRVDFPGLTVDPSRHEVLVEGKSVKLTATEMRLLHFLASHPGRVYTRDQLIRSAVGPNVVIVERNVDVRVRALRTKLAPLGDWIETVRGVGYRFRDLRS